MQKTLFFTFHLSFFAFRARMRLHIDPFYLFKGGMRIDLGGAQRRMSEERLDGTDVGAVVQHRGGEGMAEDVWRVFLERAYLPHTRAHYII